MVVVVCLPPRWLWPSLRPAIILVPLVLVARAVGAAKHIHNRLIDQRAAGTATLVISEDLDENIRAV